MQFQTVCRLSVLCSWLTLSLPMVFAFSNNLLPAPTSTTTPVVSRPSRIHPEVVSKLHFQARDQERQRYQGYHSATEDENASSSRRRSSSRGQPPWHPEKLAASILKSFLKGLTIPFPQLRDIVQRQDSNEGLSIGLRLRECVGFVAAYMAVGVLAYSYLFEKFSIVDSLYFTVVCFSTVGYGDLCPTTAAGRIFTCVFGVAGIAFLGAAIATICSTFVEAEVEAVKKVESAGKKQILSLFRDMPSKLSTFRQASETKQKELLTKAENLKERRHNLATRSPFVRCLFAVSKMLPSLSIILGGGCFLGYINGGWTVLESLYYSIITASTIGLGDFAPQTPQARLFAVFFIPLAVGAAGELLSGIATALLKRRQRRAYETQFEGNLTIEHLRAMDKDGNGCVDRAEYCFFMLKEMGLVSTEELDELFRQFDSLDVSRSGTLDQEDLRLMAKLRGAEVLD